MESTQNLKKRIKSVANINKITKTMELVGDMEALDIAVGFAIMKVIKHTAFSACRDGSFSL